ncbi:MAG: hypothetical protein A2Y34_11185 [Spirochaetes bacterium GWC1_27_15]|nr:MAG: hypothetical protein A2Z98_10620 [Spirochaetes bacterium GWB1_27_13]OHD26221.1 MAG: hypothetical protein A2Y34_11185 [Spirochaetes bacterium GWC1_27_15]
MVNELNFCLILSSQNTTKAVSNLLLNMGITCYAVDTPENALDSIKNIKTTFIFIDLDFANNVSFEFLDKLKTLEDYTSIYIIGTSFNSTEKFIKQFQLYNLAGFILKPISMDILKTKIQNLINKFKDHFPERKHIRVRPLDDELMRISFQLKNNKLITAKVIDISLGGLAAELYTNYESPELEDESVINNIIFEAGNKEIDVDAKIIHKKLRFFTVKFTSFHHNSYDSLIKYIMKKLNE